MSATASDSPSTGSIPPKPGALRWRWIGSAIASVTGIGGLIVAGVQVLGVPVLIGPSLTPAPNPLFAVGSAIVGLVWLAAGRAIAQGSSRASWALAGVALGSLAWDFALA
jgi:hypothetical protein